MVKEKVRRKLDRKEKEDRRLEGEETVKGRGKEGGRKSYGEETWHKKRARRGWIERKGK